MKEKNQTELDIGRLNCFSKKKTGGAEKDQMAQFIELKPIKITNTHTHSKREASERHLTCGFGVKL